MDCTVAFVKSKAYNNVVPKKLLVMGGGIIGLEMGTVYQKLGSEIHVVEMLDQLIPAADTDVIRAYTKANKKRFNIKLKTKVAKVEAKEDGIHVDLESASGTETVIYDAVLVAIGRAANGKLLSADKAGINVNQWGFIEVDNQMRTNIDNIFAIGDVVGNPMLAHKASYEGKIAAEVISGKKSFMDARCIPSVAYTDPEVAWVGVTEDQCKLENITYEKGVFPWSASGRSLTIGRKEGLTKLLFDPQSKKIIGGGIVGTNAGDLIAEISLAIEMNCDVEDIALTVHPHPTLAESIALAAEAFEGTITELYIKR